MKVKICGITHPDDAAHAARYGADYIGINFSKHSKRKVDPSQGEKIATAARRAGAEPVALFVEESLREILSLCAQLNIRTIQLHNPMYLDLLDDLSSFTIIYAVSVHSDGSLSPLPSAKDNLIVLFDHPGGGSGRSFDWVHFSVPLSLQSHPWILAGGLVPENVHGAIALLKPSGVDVATGVEYANSTRKDPLLVEAFIHAAKQEAL